MPREDELFDNGLSKRGLQEVHKCVDDLKKQMDQTIDKQKNEIRKLEEKILLFIDKSEKAFCDNHETLMDIKLMGVETKLKISSQANLQATLCILVGSVTPVSLAVFYLWFQKSL